MSRSIALFPAIGAALFTLATPAHAPQTAAVRKWADLGKRASLKV